MIRHTHQRSPARSWVGRTSCSVSYTPSCFLVLAAGRLRMCSASWCCHSTWWARSCSLGHGTVKSTTSGPYLPFTAWCVAWALPGSLLLSALRHPHVVNMSPRCRVCFGHQLVRLIPRFNGEARDEHPHHHHDGHAEGWAYLGWVLMLVAAQVPAAGSNGGCDCRSWCCAAGTQRDAAGCWWWCSQSTKKSRSRTQTWMCGTWYVASTTQASCEVAV